MRGGTDMKKYIKCVISAALISAMLLTSLLTMSSCGKGDTEKLYIYNWGEYIADGSEETADIIELFEAWYSQEYGKEVEVVYSMFASNEELYAKMQGGSTTIDLIIPSDYMVQRMIAEDMLTELDYDNIPNMEYIEDWLKDDEGNGSGPIYDPYCKYTVPYTYSYVGLIYNKNLVDESDIYDDEGNVIASWRDLLWSEKYKGQILNFNNSRDAFGIAQYILSYEKGKTGEDNYVNTNDKAMWDEAAELLRAQHGVVQAYVMDEVFNKMESGAAALAPYYVGDYYTMYDATYDEETDDSFLGFVYPIEGTNVFVDAMCIPKTAKNKELAEIFMNFIISTDLTIDGEQWNIARENAEYIYYGTPVTTVSQDEEYECFEDELIYPTDIENQYMFNNLEAETLDYVNSLWEKLKVESAPGISIYISAIVIWIILIAAALYFFIRKKIRAKEYGGK